MLLYFIRHGQPTYNPDALTPLGQRQAEAVGRRLALHGLDSIYASTHVRAWQTAVPASQILGLPIQPLDWAREDRAWYEFAMEDENGRRTWLQSCEAGMKLLTDPVTRALGDRWCENPAFPQSCRTGIRRIGEAADAWMLTLGYRHDGENHTWKAEHPSDQRVALFAHGGFGGVFLSWILDIPYPLFVSRTGYEHTGMTVIEFRERCGTLVPELLQYSGDGHLYAERLPTAYNGVRYI